MENNSLDYQLWDENNEKPQSADWEVRELIDIVSACRAESEFYLQSPKGNVPLPQGATEELQEVLIARRKRLQKWNLQVSKEDTELYNRKESCLLQTFDFYEDGQQRIGCLHKKFLSKTEYYSGSQKMGVFKKKIWKSYYVKREPGEEIKVSSVNKADDVQYSYGRQKEYAYQASVRWEGLSLFYKLYLMNLLAFPMGYLGGLGFAFLLIPITGIVFLLKVPVFLILLFFLWVYGLILVRGCGFVIGFRRRKKSAKVVKTIRLSQQDFCMETFISMADSRVKRLFYGESMSEVAAFVNGDFSEFLKEHENVVNCETVNFWFTGFSQDTANQYVSFRERLVIIKDLGNQVKKKEVYVKVHMIKPIVEGIMMSDFYHDWCIQKIEVV